MKSFFAVVALFYFFSSTAQEPVLKFPLNLNETSMAYDVVDENSGNLGIFAKDRRKVFSYLFNENLEEKGKLEIRKVKRRHEIISGYYEDPGQVRLLLSNSARSRFSRLNIDFENNNSNYDKLDLKLGREGFIAAKTSPERDLIFSVPRSANIIRVYEFKKDDTPLILELNFKKHQFLNEVNNKVKLFNAFISSEDFQVPQKILPDTPSSIEHASKKTKVYEDGDKMVISLDTNHHLTYLLDIDTKTFKVKVRKIAKPEVKDRSVSNSFLFENKLFQVTASKEELSFHVVDLETEEVIKSYDFTKDEEIFFSNTPIIREGSSASEDREYEETSRFLRKIHKKSVGIAVLKQEKNYQISLGRPLESDHESPVDMSIIMIGGMLPGMEGTGTPVETSYAFSKTLRFTGLFDSDFNHIEGQLQPDVFEKIRSFAEDEEENISAETAFQKNNEFYWGYYNDQEREYKLVKFK